MRHNMLHEQLRTFYNGFRRDAHPMAVMCGVVGALSAFYHDSLDIHDPESRRISAFRLIAKVPTIAAWAHKYSVGQPFVYPRNDLTYAENFLYMFHAVPTEEYKVNPVLSKAMDLIMILHADHEQNASTSTVRLAGSTGANPFACIAAGIASLWGPAHGGANEAVLKMLAAIGNAKNIKPFLDDVKDRDNHDQADGLRPPGLQELRSAGENHPEGLPRRAGGTRDQGRSAARSGDGTGKDRAERPVLHRSQAVSERRFLFRHHPEGDGLPDQHVHRAVRGVAHGRLGRPVEGNDGGSAAAHRPSAADLHRRAAPGLRAGHERG